MQRACAIWSSVACLTLQNPSTIPHKQQDFREKVLCVLILSIIPSEGKGKAVPLQAWSGPEGSRNLRFPDYMTTQDGGKVVSPTRRPSLPPGNAPGTHFCWRLSRLQGHSGIGRITSMKNSNDTIWNRTSDLPIGSTAP